MKSVKVPAAVIVLVLIVIIGGLVYLCHHSQQLAQQLADNEKLKSETEKAKVEMQLLALQTNLQDRLETMVTREPIGFRTEGRS